MVAPREALSTVTFIDHYCTIYRSLFANVRSFEAFKFLHLGMVSEIPRQSITLVNVYQQKGVQGAVPPGWGLRPTPLLSAVSSI